MTRILKLAAAGIGAAAAVAGAVFLEPRSGARRRARVRRESANVAALVGSAMDAPARTWHRASAQALGGEARDALDAAFGERSEDITVKAGRGVVTLRGEVDDIDDIARFEAVVRLVPGVEDVDNLLRLRLRGVVRPRVLSA